MAKKSTNPARDLATKLRQDLERVLEDVRKLELNPKGRSVLSGEIQRSAAVLNGLLAEIDPVDRPAVVFDPGNPRTVGFFVALAATAQPRKPLSTLKDFYGSGIYAIYYEGDFEPYRAISASETPIYVGMAVHSPIKKREPASQGTPLSSRLNEHRKNIEKAKDSLNIADFSYRALVVQSGWEAPAEDYLIRLFQPLWNRETNILYGFGKHGDSVLTRRNKRSPWDTLHSGRKWADGDEQADAMTTTQIIEKVTVHLGKTRVFKTYEDLLHAFMLELKQSQ